MKKKNCVGDWMGYYPFSSLSHDTMDCIVTQGAGACSRGPRYSQEALRHGPTIRPRGPATRPHDTVSRATTRLACAPSERRMRSRMAWPWGESRYNSLYHGWGRPLVSRYSAARLRYSAATRKQRVATRKQHATTRCYDTARGKIWVAIQFLYLDRRGQ